MHHKSKWFKQLAHRKWSFDTPHTKHDPNARQTKDCFETPQSNTMKSPEKNTKNVLIYHTPNYLNAKHHRLFWYTTHQHFLKAQHTKNCIDTPHTKLIQTPDTPKSCIDTHITKANHAPYTPKRFKHPTHQNYSNTLHTKNCLNAINVLHTKTIQKSYTQNSAQIPLTPYTTKRVKRSTHQKQLKLH